MECSDRCYDCGIPFANTDDLKVTAEGTWYRGKMQRIHGVHLVHKFCPARKK